MCWELPKPFPNQLFVGLPPGNSSGWGGRFKTSFYTRNEAADMPSVIQYGPPDKLNNTSPLQFAWLSALHWLVKQSTNSQQLFHTTANLRPASNHRNCKLPMGRGCVNSVGKVFWRKGAGWGKPLRNRICPLPGVVIVECVCEREWER